MYYLTLIMSGRPVEVTRDHWDVSSHKGFQAVWEDALSTGYPNTMINVFTTIDGSSLTVRAGDIQGMVWEHYHFAKREFGI